MGSESRRVGSGLNCRVRAVVGAILRRGRLAAEREETSGGPAASALGSTQDVGWVRYAFDHFELNYDLIYKERVRKGSLRSAYDVIVIPSQGRGGAKAL